MNKVRYAVALVIASLAWLAGSPSHAATGKACDSIAGDSTDKICYIDVYVKNNLAWTDPTVTFPQPSKVMLVWRIKQLAGTAYGFQTDALWLPVNADIKAFDKPQCPSPDGTNCEATAGTRLYYIWQVKQAMGDSKFEYKLKLYPLNSALRTPIVVQARNPDRIEQKTKSNKKTKAKTQSDPIWVDPTIVIQG